MTAPAGFRENETFRLRTEPVTTRQLVMYAGASGDYNPIHYDLPHAQSAGLGGVIAHGMLTMGFAGKCLTDWLPVNARVIEFSGRFLSPVRPGDVVDMIGTVDSIDGNEVNVTIVGSVEDTTVFRGRASMLISN